MAGRDQHQAARLAGALLAAVLLQLGQDGWVIEHAERRWGAYTVLAETEGFKVKTIEVTLDGSSIDVRRGDAVDVPVGAAHRIQNTGSDVLVFVEVQPGDYFGEDDIVRLDDDYGRVPRNAGL
jgi:mannose-6-phosphate isomerase